MRHLRDVAGLLLLLIAAVPGTAGDAGQDALQVSEDADSGRTVALFTATTVMDVPGRASVPNRLEIRCSGDHIRYIVIDFATPRLSNRTATLDARLEHDFGAGGGDAGGDPKGHWRLHYDALEWQSRAIDDYASLRNLQLDRMVYLGDASAWLRRLARADYVTIEQPARGERRFVFELSHVAGALQRLTSHCGE